jgi:hypothetical protein
MVAMKKAGMSKSEIRVWQSLQAKGRRHGIAIKLIPDLSKVRFGDGLHANLGGSATEIMDARIKVKKNRSKRRTKSTVLGNALGTTLGRVR